MKIGEYGTFTEWGLLTGTTTYYYKVLDYWSDTYLIKLNKRHRKWKCVFSCTHHTFTERCKGCIRIECKRATNISGDAKVPKLLGMIKVGE